MELYKQREQQQRNELRQWLNISEDDMSKLIFESGYEYLQEVLRTDDYGIEQLPATKAFWNMFIVEVWNKIDRAFLDAIDHTYMQQYPTWFCVLKERDGDHLIAIYNQKQLRKHYDWYHRCDQRNPLINKTDFSAQQHHLLRSILEEYHKNQNQYA